MIFNIINKEDYKGVLPGIACGWQFEFRNQKTGEVKLASNFWQDHDQNNIYPSPRGLSEEEINDCVPTGNVYFYGYAYPEYSDEYTIDKVNPITEEELNHMIEIRDTMDLYKSTLSYTSKLLSK